MAKSKETDIEHNDAELFIISRYAPVQVFVDSTLVARRHNSLSITSLSFSFSCLFKCTPSVKEPNITTSQTQ